MRVSSIVKFVVVAVVVLVWRRIAPDLTRGSAAPATRASTASSREQGDCAGAAAHASETWGSGLSHFVNPPYDLNAWSDFRSSVERDISSAESLCRESRDSCEKSRGALHDLRGLVSDLDTSIHNTTPPPDDLVQRQERIDQALDSARELQRDGK